MKFIVRPKSFKIVYGSCNADCSNNCFGKCNKLGNCFCPWDK